jgi:hypothetical protein
MYLVRSPLSEFMGLLPMTRINPALVAVTALLLAACGTQEETLPRDPAGDPFDASIEVGSTEMEPFDPDDPEGIFRIYPDGAPPGQLCCYRPTASLCEQFEMGGRRPCDEDPLQRYREAIMQNSHLTWMPCGGPNNPSYPLETGPDGCPRLVVCGGPWGLCDLGRRERETDAGVDAGTADDTRVEEDADTMDASGDGDRAEDDLAGGDDNAGGEDDAGGAEDHDLTESAEDTGEPAEGSAG